MDIWEEIKDSFRNGTILAKLIYVNLAVFLVVKLITVMFFLFAGDRTGGAVLLPWIAVPADLGTLITRPWTLLTYMFLHEAFFHILFNLIALYLFGRIFLRFLTEKQFLNVYLLGGFAGAALFILSFNVFPVFQGGTQSIALGASAAVMAIIFAVSFYIPDHEVYIPFLKNVKLKYIALIFVVLDVIQIPTSNSGGHIAHLGGALFGFLYISRFKQGKDISRGFSRYMDNMVSWFKFARKSRSHLKVTHKKEKAREETDVDYNKRRAEEQKEVDRILDKIANSGYKSLTQREKELLFKMSDKN